MSHGILRVRETYQKCGPTGMRTRLYPRASDFGSETGTLDPNVARLFSRLQKFRQDADYSAEFVFTQEGAAEEVAAARTFVAEARSILERGGWIASSD